jgi:hypothetical protein
MPTLYLFPLAEARPNQELQKWSNFKRELTKEFLKKVQPPPARGVFKTREDELTGLDGIFFRVGPMVLQMEIDGLGYCHGAPPVVGVVGGKRYEA